VKHVASLKKVTLHQVAQSRRILLGATIAVLYAISGHFVYTTIGEPRRLALAGQKEVALDEWWDDPWADSEDPAALKAKAKETEIDSEIEKELSMEDDPELSPDPVLEENSEKGTNSTSSKPKKKSRRIPSRYQPNAWAGAALFLVISGHILFHLMCYWRPAFKARTLYEPAKNIREGLYALVEPHLHRGKAALVQITKTGPQGRQKLAFVFQRLRYELDDDGTVSPLKCPVDLSLSEYATWGGLSDREVKLRKEHYGLNQLSVPPPKFLDLYKEQLVSPIVVFQVFCAILWALDEYWQYTVFQLISILMLESASVFQRIKTINSLNGMSAKPTIVKVFRGGEWRDVTTDKVLPGDLMSIKFTHPDSLANEVKKKKSDTKAIAKRKKGADSKGTDKKSAADKTKEKAAKAAATALNIVPCDCLLLSGTAVANEASLTGESIPQMKDAIRPVSDTLKISSEHRIHTLFSGTMLVNTNPNANNAATKDLPKTPDGGCLAYVLRTGFNSSQGELMQMIEFSTQKVADNSRETFLALLVLLLFALAASGYVLYKGIQKGERSTHELLLRCVIIIASVVPRQLPMQMAVAVNTALLALMRQGVFCTEPFRMPFAGKITHCLFDKTGTLTTDQLLPTGVVNNRSSRKSESKQDSKKARGKVPVVEANADAAMVLAGCHSLVSVEGAGLVGDPIELAAIKGIEWSFNPQTNVATPGDSKSYAERIKDLSNRIVEEGKEPQGAGIAVRKYRERMAEYQKALQKAKANRSKAEDRARKFSIRSIKIIRRFHFLSKLQRMAVIADVTTTNGTKRACLVKGSPEMIGRLLAKDAIPPWYQITHRSLAEKGMRVLALAYKWVDTKEESSSKNQQDRKWVESSLRFAGFIAFACNTRTDSRLIVQSLLQSDHRVAMITGDAALTALHVAGEVGIGIPASDSAPLVLRKADDGFLEWHQALQCAEGEKPLVKSFDVDNVRELGEKHTLLVTEKALLAASDFSKEEIWKHVDCIHVFARMSPQGKAKVIQSMQRLQGHHVLMCGDGGNDVGALKQADVGLALLSGYGNTNAAGDEIAKEAEEKTAEESLNEMKKELGKRSKESAALQKKLMAAKQKELLEKQKIWLNEEIEARRARGEEGIMAHFYAVQASMSRMTRELKEEKAKLARKYGNIYDQQKPTEATDATVLPTVRPGDASVAAPFTSRAPSVANVVTLIRQGRCTLLSALQQQQIMMLECIITAYTLSALSLEGARSSQRQMMASQWLIMIASLSFSYAKPVDTLSKVRPLNSLFHPAVFFSMLGQAVIHLTCMWYAVKLATETMGPDKLQEVVDFHRRDDEKEAALAAAAAAGGEEEEDWDFWTMWEKPFLPNLMNTVIFLVETSQIIAILFVNYKGRPWMNGLMENHSLFLSIFLCVALVATCAWGYFPQLNTLIHLEPFPDDIFRWQVMGLVFASLVGTFIWDRIIVSLFAKPIFRAMLDSAGQTRIKDLVPIFMTVLKIGGGLMLLGSGNILLWIGAFYAYRRFFRKAE